MKKSYIVTLVVLLILVIDQATKMWVKTNMFIGEDSFLNWGWTPMWARIHFVENNGMAFGFELWAPYGKLILSLFRIVAVGFLVYFIRKLIQAKASLGLLISIALILAGAIGNILDSAFYGLIFSASSQHGNAVATLLPDGGGYAGFLHGKVVDMLYFPLYEGFLPSWFPFWKGEHFEFFRPVFNIADVSISSGVISILLFQRSFFSAESPKKGEESVGDTTAEMTGNSAEMERSKTTENIKTETNPADENLNIS